MRQHFNSYDELPVMLNVSDLQQVFPLSKAGIYNLVNSKNFPIIRIGRRVVVPRDKLICWINENTNKCV